MKTIYLFKSGFPAFFLPLAPEVVQGELQRHGIIAAGGGMFTVISLQILLTVVIVVWLVRSHRQRKHDQAFLKMSCVSKKVFHEGRWMTVERYLAEQHNIVVSHGLTPEESDEWLREAHEWVDSRIHADAAGLEPALK